MGQVMKEDNPEQKKAPTYVKVTSAILVISTVLTMAAYKQRQKTYEELATLIESFCEASEALYESNEQIINSNENLKQSIDAMRELLY